MSSAPGVEVEGIARRTARGSAIVPARTFRRPSV